MQTEYQRDWRLQKRYGISAETYDRMLQVQGGVCALCFTLPKSNRLHVDHDPETNRVRGLLCTSCNTTIGKIDRIPGRELMIHQYRERGRAY